VSDLAGRLRALADEVEREGRVSESTVYDPRTEHSVGRTGSSTPSCGDWRTPTRRTDSRRGRSRCKNAAAQRDRARCHARSSSEVGCCPSTPSVVLNSYDICARRAQYDLEPPGPRRTSEAAIIGTGYHAGLEHYYRAADGRAYPDAGLPAPKSRGASSAAHNTIVEEIGRYDPDCITWDTNPTNAIKIAQEMLEAYLTEGHVWGPEYKILGVEVPFWLPSGYPGWVSHGTIDLVLEGPWPSDDHPRCSAPCGCRLLRDPR
jgi:hypothetical protein